MSHLAFECMIRFLEVLNHEGFQNHKEGVIFKW